MKRLFIYHSVAAWAFLSAGQAQPQAAQEPAFRATARLVQVNVIVENRQGAPVGDLTQADFTLLDGGRPEQIRVFAANGIEARPSAPPVPAPNTFSNHLERTMAGNPSGTVILFDGLNTRIPDQAYARQQIISFLKQLQPGDRVSLYVLGRGPRVLQGFTSEPRALLDALANYKSEISPSLDAPLHDVLAPAPVLLDAWLGELTFNLVDHFARDRALRTVRTLVAISNHLARVPGRKNLIWVSGSFPDWIGLDSIPLRKRTRGDGAFPSEIDRAVRALNDCTLAVYPVDARGLTAPADYSPDRSITRPEMKAPDAAMLGTMRMFAERTGGRAFYNTNDLRSAIRQAADDARVSYLLGYEPSHATWDGKFREIKVVVNRPGLRFPYRRGYFAQPEESTDSRYRQAVMDAATWSPMDATQIGLTVRTTTAAGALNLDIQIDTHDLAFVPKGGSWNCSLDVWLVQLGAQDRHLNTTARTSNLSLDQSRWGPQFATIVRYFKDPSRSSPGSINDLYALY